jgi:hypothetical protein
LADLCQNLRWSPSTSSLTTRRPVTPPPPLRFRPRPLNPPAGPAQILPALRWSRPLLPADHFGAPSPQALRANRRRSCGFEGSSRPQRRGGRGSARWRAMGLGRGLRPLQTRCATSFFRTRWGLDSATSKEGGGGGICIFFSCAVLFFIRNPWNHSPVCAAPKGGVSKWGGGSPHAPAAPSSAAASARFAPSDVRPHPQTCSPF